MIIDTEFWKGKRVFLTGHTGFKGSWLSVWLHAMGAEVTGYALDPPTDPSLFQLAGVEEMTESVIGDIRDFEHLYQTMVGSSAEIVFHMAAQPLVRDSYSVPRETYEINVGGTVNILEAVRKCPTVGALLVVTTDKVYESRNWVWRYRENDRLGGHDPYSSSKACAEIVTSAYRDSFFSVDDPSRQRHVAIATARAGNVIGGGDWARDRLIPDCVRSLTNREAIAIRNPLSIRPWQHVLEPLSGYLMLCQRLYEDGSYGGAWNFGPSDESEQTVESIVSQMARLWEPRGTYEIHPDSGPHESQTLRLDSTKARTLLGWRPRWDLEHALRATVAWHKIAAGKMAEDIRDLTRRQIATYVESSCIDR